MMRIVTVVDSISETSMPINEFVLYRELNNYDVKQSLLVCTEDERILEVPSSINTCYVGQSIKRMRVELERIISSSTRNQEKIVIHLHSPKSAFFFYIASLGMKLRNKTLFTVHSTYRYRNLEYKITSSICALAANYVTCVSDVAYQEYSSIVKRIKKDRIFPIVNGVDVNRIKKNPDVNNYRINKEKMCNLICVARIIPIKNQSFLIEVLKRISDVRLILVGEEDKEHVVRKLAVEEGVIDRVVFTGLVPREKVFSYLCECGIYVSASLVEGMPLSVLEAMCIGLIPVVSDIPSHCEIAKKFDGAMKVAKLNIEDWVNAIENIRAQNTEVLRASSKYIKKQVEKCFSLEEMHKEYMDLYYRMERENDA